MIIPTQTELLAHRLAHRITEIDPAWLPIAGHVRNVTFTLTECDLVITALRDFADARAVKP